MNRPATREYAYEVTVPAGTPVNAPYEEPTRFNPGEVVQVEIIVPDGAAGLAGIALTSSGVPVMPILKGQYFVGNGEPIVREVQGYPNSGDWGVVAYNTDIHPHTFQIRYSVKEITEKLPEAKTGTGLALTSTGEPVGASGNENEPNGGTGETGPPGEGEQPATPPGSGEGEGATPPAEEPTIAPQETPPAEEPPPGEVPLGEFTGAEQGAEPEGEIPAVPEEGLSLGGEGGGAGEVPTISSIKAQPTSGAPKKIKRKPAKKKPKKGKPTKRKPAAKGHHPTKGVHKSVHRKKPATKAKAKKAGTSHATRRAPAKAAAHHAAKPPAHRAPAKPKPTARPKPKAAAPRPKPAPTPRKPPPPKPAPPKRKPPPPPRKRR